MSRFQQRLIEVTFYRSLLSGSCAHFIAFYFERAINNNPQVILGEHESLLESDVNDEGMETDPEVEKLTQNGNMEQLAELVLNGEGRRLVGRQSSNPELQSFIDNVPAYMVLYASSVKKLIIIIIIIIITIIIINNRTQ